MPCYFCAFRFHQVIGIKVFAIPTGSETWGNWICNLLYAGYMHLVNVNNSVLVQVCIQLWSVNAFFIDIWNEKKHGKEACEHGSPINRTFQCHHRLLHSLMPSLSASKKPHISNFHLCFSIRILISPSNWNNPLYEDLWQIIKHPRVDLQNCGRD